MLMLLRLIREKMKVLIQLHRQLIQFQMDSLLESLKEQLLIPMKTLLLIPRYKHINQSISNNIMKNKQLFEISSKKSRDSSQDSTSKDPQRES